MGKAGLLKDKEDGDMEISMAAAATPQHNRQRLCDQADNGSSRAPLSRPASAGVRLHTPDERTAEEHAQQDEEDEQEESDLSAAAAPRQQASGCRRRARSSGSPSDDNLSMTGLMDSDSEVASNPTQSSKEV